MNRTFSGTFNATLNPGTSGFAPSGGLDATTAELVVQVNVPWGGVSIHGIAQHFIPPHPHGWPDEYQHRVIASASVVTGAGAGGDTGVLFGAMPTFNGGWSISCETVPALSYVDLDPDLVDPTTKIPWKFYAAGFILDGTPGLKGPVDEWLKVGSVVSASIWGADGGASVSATVLASGISVAEMEAQVYAQGTITGIFEDPPQDCLVDASLAWSGLPLVYLNTHDYSNADQRVAITVSSMALRTSQAAGDVWGTFDSSPPLKYHLHGELLTMDGAYPTSKDIAFIDHSEWVGPAIGGSYVDTVTIFPANPNVDHVATTYFWKVESNFHAAPTNNSVIYQHYATDFYFDQPNRPLAWLQNPSQNGDDPNDWRLGFLGKAYKAGTLHRNGPIVVDDGSSAANWAAGGNTVVTSDGNSVSMAVAGGAGSATGSYAPKKVSEGYGVLQLQIQSIVGDGVPITLTANGGKQWQLFSGNHGAWRTLNLYLTAPINAGGWDLQTWRFPLDVSGEPHNEGNFWGLNRIGSLLFSGIPNGETIKVRNIKLVTLGQAKATFLPAFGPGAGWQTINFGGNDFGRPFFRGLADGRIAWDWYDMIQTYDPMTATYSPTWPSIGNFFDSINLLPGWTIIPETVFPDSYHNLNRYPTWLFGGNGAWYDHSAGVWHSGIQQPAEGLTLYAQPICDFFKAYPDCINPFTGIHTGEMPLTFRKILRSDADGLAINTAGEYVAGAVAKMLEPGGTIVDQGNTDALGYYIASSGNGAKGNQLYKHSLTSAGATTTSASRLVPVRMRMRASAGADHEHLKCPSYDVSKTGRRHHYTSISPSAGNEIYLNVSSNVSPLVWTPRDTGQSGVWANFRLDKRDGGIILLVYEDGGGNVQLISTRNEGQTWTMPTAIGAGHKPCIIVGQNRQRFIYWNTAAAGTSGLGSIKGTILDAAGNVLVPAFTALAGTVDDDAIAVDESVLASGVHRIVLIYVSNGTVKTIESTDGQNFA